MFCPRSTRSSLLALIVGCAKVCVASPTTIFAPISTPGREVQQLSHFVILITAAIFVGVAAITIFVLVRFRSRPSDTNEPPQIFGSTQIELAWTIIPILGITVLFLGTARVIFAIQDAPKPPSALDVIVIGHQYWWEYRYPQFNVVTANELHVPVSDPHAPTPTFLKLTSADVIHSFWVPRLSGKTDVLPNRVNEMWFDPQVPGVYEGQCAQFCGMQHAKMLIKVFVDPPEQFQAWIKRQQQIPPSAGAPALMQTSLSAPNPGLPAAVPANSPGTMPVSSAQMQQASRQISPQVGKQVFEQQACINCHTIAGTVANGRFGPDLTHLMSRQTIGSALVRNNPENLQRWITDPGNFKPGTTMPAMHLTDRENAQITAYLLTLR